MPGLAKYNQFSNSNSNGLEPSSFWSDHGRDVTYNHLQKFWTELSTQARHELLRIDKQTLFEHARKNMYCSRCNGLLSEGFTQIAMYTKSSLPHECGNVAFPCIRQGASKSKNDIDTDLTTVCQDEVQDPSIHPWGGLTAPRDGVVTLLDCYLYAKSLKGLQIVFDSARARERERELLYPDACGGGGRGWISQGLSVYGRGHGTRETCALHTARLSVDTLVEFWNALGEENRLSLLRMKEEDFLERLTYRFESKRFCRDCRKNVQREFRELKELKRTRKETRCTAWFCVADTAFQYEVTDDSIEADWHHTFGDKIGIYRYFEWAVGTGEGRSDILEFDNVGMSKRVKVSGLDLSGLTACYITLRAWKVDGRCNEFCVKAHASKGQQCVHCRLVAGDGLVSITRGESIQRFFEHAEEAEEDEDDDAMDKDGNDLDPECSRPQKHAKSPELAREFLLDAATVIFKEQVEKAFRDGTARQNAHSIFVCLALQMLEERVHVACKEIITLEKQTKLLEEEEKEKREEEERKERRRAKEREKKLRRKERLRVKDKDKEQKSSVSSEIPGSSHGIGDEEDESPISCEQSNVNDDMDAVSGSVYSPSGPVSPNTQDEHVLNDPIIPEIESLSNEGHDGEFTEAKNDSDPYSVDHSKISHRKPKFEAYSQNSNGWNKQSRVNPMKSNARNYGPKYGERFHYRNDVNSCTSCNRHSEYKPKAETHNVPKQYYRVNKYNQMDYTRENGARPKSKVMNGNYNRDLPHIKQVWEPTDSLRKYPRSNSDADMSPASTCKTESGVSDKIKLAGAVSSEKISGQLHETSNKENNNLKEAQSSKDTVDENTKKCAVTKFKHKSVSSASDNCSSCLSEGDSNTSSSSSSNPESSSDSEDVGRHTIRKETSVCVEKVLPKYQEPKAEIINFAKEEVTRTGTIPEHSHEKGSFSNDLPRNQVHNMDDLRPGVNINSQHPGMVPTMHDPSIPFSMYQTPPLSTMGYYHQGPVSWGPPAHTNGLLPFHPPNHYVFPSPFEYGMNMDQYFMQYGAHQHSTPLLNRGEVPVYQPVVNSKDQTVNLKTCEAQESLGKVGMQKAVPVGPPASKKVAGGNNLPNGNLKKSDEANTGFSLFHFGTPVALSAGYQLNPVVPCKDGIVEDEHNCNNKKEKPIEEYNLFAGSNGTRFPFF